MAKIPLVTEKRLKLEIPKFKRILKTARDKDINEADTVVIITDMLERVFGFDKYEDVTREFAIKGTFVDLAIKVEDKIDYLIEVKSIGTELKELHLRQAIGYASKEGVKWAILTNGIEWQIHRVNVDKQVTNESILKFNFLDIKPSLKKDLESIFLLCKRGISSDAIEDYYNHKQVFNRYTVGAILITDDILKAVKRVLRKVSPGMKIDDDDLREKISNNILKRDILESESGIEAIKSLKKTLSKLDRAKKKN